MSKGPNIFQDLLAGGCCMTFALLLFCAAAGATGVFAVIVKWFWNLV